MVFCGSLWAGFREAASLVLLCLPPPWWDMWLGQQGLEASRPPHSLRLRVYVQLDTGDLNEPQ